MFKNPTTINQDILAITQQYWNKYVEYMPEGSEIGTIPPVTFAWKKSRVAGFAYYSGKVEFNVPYFLSHPNQADLEEIIAHELAHIIQYRIYPHSRQAHGPEFRYIMNCIGFSGRTYHYMNVAAAKSVAASSHLKQLTVEL